MILSLKILVALSVLVLIIGMIRPKWVLFFLKNPDRLSVTAVAMAMFMIGMTGIAKLTLKPRSPTPVERSADDANQLQLTR
ncbi:MAG: hypothetical protein U1E83_07555 [Methylotetracoccus sp.]